MREHKDWLSRRTVRVYNITTETIPGFACMTIVRNSAPHLVMARNPQTGAQTGQPETPASIVFHVAKPEANAEALQDAHQLLFNGPVPIPPQQYGWGTMDWPAQALFKGGESRYGSSGLNASVPFGATAGPKSGSWQLEIGGAAFTVLGTDWTSFAYPGSQADFSPTSASSNSRIWVAPLMPQHTVLARNVNHLPEEGTYVFDGKIEYYSQESNAFEYQSKCWILHVNSTAQTEAGSALSNKNLMPLPALHPGMVFRGTIAGTGEVGGETRTIVLIDRPLTFLAEIVSMFSGTRGTAQLIPRTDAGGPQPWRGEGDAVDVQAVPSDRSSSGFYHDLVDGDIVVVQWINEVWTIVEVCYEATRRTLKDYFDGIYMPL